MRGGNHDFTHSNSRVITSPSHSHFHLCYPGCGNLLRICDIRDTDTRIEDYKTPIPYGTGKTPRGNDSTFYIRSSHTNNLLDALTVAI